MDKKLLGLIGAVSALATLDVASASAMSLSNAPDVMQARSFGDLLEPIPNAAATLRAVDAARGAAAETGVQLAQYDGGDGYDQPAYHHHHHHQYYRPRYHPPVYYHHHHHHQYYRRPTYHHHHQQYDNGY